MAKLMYWIAEDLDDAECYSIIAKTKKEVVRIVASRSKPERYGAPVKKELFYKDAFDLFDWCTSEGGGRACGNTLD